jgi:hypothetical protein
MSRIMHICWSCVPYLRESDYKSNLNQFENFKFRTISSSEERQYCATVRVW